MKDKVKQPARNDSYGAKPINVSEGAGEQQFRKCEDCNQPLTMADLGASRKVHLFCPPKNGPETK